MELPNRPVTKEEFFNLIRSYLKNDCMLLNGIYRHAKCHTPVKQGFANLYYVNEDGTLNGGADGFGIGPTKVPYCEKCDEPDGFKYTYTQRVGIIPE